MSKISTSELWDRFDQFEEKMDKRFVTKTEFLPVRVVVYGAIALILTKVASTGLAYLATNYDIITVASAMGF